MKKSSIVFLQAVTVLIGLAALLILARFPMTEGRAQGLDLLSIYLDPLILYGYASSIAFFTALYKAFRFLGYMRENKLFSPSSVNALRSIKHCAIIFAIAVLVAGIYISIFHDPKDDAAGFISMSILLTFISVAASIAFAVAEKALQKAVDIKNENDLTI